MYHWTEYAQTNAQPRPLSDKKDFGICPLIPELEPREVHTLGLHHPVCERNRGPRTRSTSIVNCFVNDDDTRSPSRIPRQRETQ